jgi:oligosaccharide repeat unit polymerase
MFQAVRTEMVQGDLGKSVGLGVYSYLIEFLSVMTLIVATETCRLRLSKWRLGLWITLMLAFCVPTGSRLGLLIAAFGVLGIFAFVKNRISLLATLSVSIAVLAIFAVPAITLGKGGSLYASSLENIGGVARSFQVYALGGIVACDQLLQSPPEQPEEARSLHFFYAVAATLGLHTRVPNQTDVEVLIPWKTNVYSVYYHYLEDFGWTGMCAAFFVLGAAFAGLHGAAATGRPEAITLLGLGCSYLVFTCAGDPFFWGLSSCIQCIAIVLIIYNVAPLLRVLKLASATRPTVGGGQNRVFHGNITRHYHCELEHQGGASRMSTVDRSGPPGGDRSTTSGRGG